MPFVTQLCNKITITERSAERTWNILVRFAPAIYGGKISDFYGDNPSFVSPNRLNGPDMVFVVHLDATLVRLNSGSLDRNASNLAEIVGKELEQYRYKGLKIGVLTHHGYCGWGEFTTA